MEWLDKVDELATQFIPENYRDIDSDQNADNDASMVIENILDGDVQYDNIKKEERKNEESSEKEGRREEKNLITEEVGNENEEEFETFIQNSPQNPSKYISVGPIVPERCLLDDDDTVNNNEVNDENIKQLAEEGENNDLPPIIVHQSTGDVTAEEGHRMHDSRNHFRSQTVKSSASQQKESSYNKDEQECSRSTTSNVESKYRLKKNCAQEIVTSDSDHKLEDHVTGNLPMKHLPVDQKEKHQLNASSIFYNLHGQLDSAENFNVSSLISKKNTITSSKLDFEKKPIKSTIDSYFTLAKDRFLRAKINVANEKLQDAINFDMAEPLNQWNKTSSTSLDASKNCMGVVQVRVLAAQRLMCPIGSTVNQ